MKVSSCFCCFSLQTGSIIAACTDLCLILAIFLVCCILGLYGADLHNILWTKANPDLFLCGAMFFFVLNYFVGTALIIGALKKNPLFLLPWLVLKVYYIVLVIALGCPAILCSFSHEKIGVGLLLIVFVIFHTAFSAYLYIVVISFYLSLSED